MSWSLTRAGALTLAVLSGAGPALADDTLEGLRDQAERHQRAGDLAAAAEALQQAVLIGRRERGAGPVLDGSGAQLVSVYWRSGRYLKLERTLYDQLDDAQLRLDSQPGDLRARDVNRVEVHIARLIRELGILYTHLGRYDEAETKLNVAASLLEGELSASHPEVAHTVVHRARIHSELGRHELAVGEIRDHSRYVYSTVYAQEHARYEATKATLPRPYVYNPNATFLQQVMANAPPPDFSGVSAAVAQWSADVALARAPITHLIKGRVFDRAGEVKPAAQQYQKAIDAARRRDPSLLTVSRAEYAGFLIRQGELDEAEGIVSLALPAALASANPAERWAMASASLELEFARGDSDEAILLAKLGVNELQRARSGLAPMGSRNQQAFLRRHEPSYRALIRMLITDGRLAEAEQVLRMLKAEEYYGFVNRSADGEPSDAGTVFVGQEKPIVARLEAVRTSVFEAARELDRLHGIDPDRHTPDDAARIRQLESEVGLARDAFAAVLADVGAAFTEAAGGRAVELGEMGLDRLEGAQDTLAGLGPGVALLSTVVTDATLYLLLTTADGQVAEQVQIGAGDLNAAVFEFREALQDRGRDPRPEAGRLYDLLIRPVEGHLADADVEMLMVSLDGNLRYMPVSALHDGERWLVEIWPTAVFTAAAEADLLKRSEAPPGLLALGVSEAATVGEIDFSALPAVRDELDALVRAESGDEHGVVPGQIYLDDAFTRGRLTHALKSPEPWVHLASHFYFRPGTDADSFLLLGGQERLTLADLRTGSFSMKGVDLLTLSACDTAMGVVGQDGREVEGLAVLAQSRGARGVLATLWPIDDGGTAAWMASMYGHMMTGDSSKATATQRAQLGFLHGEAGMLEEGTRGPTPVAAPAGVPDDLLGTRHPYYWAPFVLMGNWL